jgi:FSR family fosmidomycin resistance protein-like MFS transporter
MFRFLYTNTSRIIIYTNNPNVSPPNPHSKTVNLKSKIANRKSSIAMLLLFDALFSSVASSHLIVDVLNSSRPVLLTYLGLTATQIALISTIYIWASALTQPFFGWVSDRVGPRWLAAGGVLWMASFYSGAVFIPGAGGLLCLILAALGSSSFHPVGTVQATLQGRNRLAGRETTAASLFFMAGQLGHFVGPILTGLILARLGLPAVVILPIISIPIGLTLAYQLRANQPHPQPTHGDHKLRLQASLGFIATLAIVATLQSWSQANMINFLPKYLKDLGLSAATYGNMAGLFMGGSALGNVIGGHLGDRYAKRKVAATALFFAAFPIYLMSRIGWSPWLYLLIPVAGAFTGSVHSIMVVLAQRMISGGMALASGLILGFIFSSGALGMLLTGPMAEHQGFPTVLLMTTGLVLFASPLAWMLKEKTAEELNLAKAVGSPL